MSRRVRVKKVHLQSGTPDKGLAEMFNQVLAGDGVNPSISYPRYCRLRALCEGVIKICRLLIDASDRAGWPADCPARSEFRAFHNRSVEEIEKLFTFDLSQYEWNLELVDEDLRKRFAAVYKCARESNVIAETIATCDALVPFKNDIADVESLNPKFVNVMSGVEWTPVAFSPSLNIKGIFVTPDITPTTIRTFLMMLHKLYTFGRAMYNEIQSPDIDVDKFVEFITSNIDLLKNRDGLSRCDEAFEKIKESTKLLKSNFGSYYRQFVDTGDSTIIMQSFITDVSTNTKVKPQVLRQFRTIINYCTKVAASQSKDPRLKEACAKLQETITVLDRKYHNISTENAPKPADSEPDSDESDDGDDPDIAERTAAMSKTVEQLAAEIGE